MVKPQRGLDPLLRRPFSIFEILRDDRRRADRPQPAEQARRRRHVAALRRASRAIGIACLGPLGQPFVPVDPPAEAWMVAGGVGLAPFATLAEALAARGTPMTLFYGGRIGADLYYADRSSSGSARRWS